jgi:hypothetical protein
MKGPEQALHAAIVGNDVRVRQWRRLLLPLGRVLTLVALADCFDFVLSFLPEAHVLLHEISHTFQRIGIDRGLAFA